MKSVLKLTLAAALLAPMAGSGFNTSDWEDGNCPPDITCWCLAFVFEVPWENYFERHMVVNLEWGDAAGGSYSLAQAKGEFLAGGTVTKKPQTGYYAVAMNPGPSTGGEIWIPHVLPCVPQGTPPGYFAVEGDFRFDDYVAQAHFYNCSATAYWSPPPGWE